MTLEYPIEVLPPGWETRKVWIRHRGQPEEVRYEVIDTATQNRYLHEPLKVTAEKCFGIFLGGQLYGLGYILWHFLRAPLVAISICFQAIRLAAKDPKAHRIQHLFSAIFWKAPLAFCKNIGAVFRAPYYALRMELAGLYGCFNPLKGRILIGKIEQSWHHRSRRNDQVHYQEMLTEKIWRGLTDPDNKRTLFLAYCMQSWGNMGDDNLIRSEVQSGS